MKIVNNRKMLISLMTIFGFSVFVESNCCNGASMKLRLRQIQQAEAQEAKVQQARVQQDEKAKIAQTNQNTQNINDMRGRIQAIEDNLQNQINPDINAVKNELQELREQITRQNHHITCLEYGAGLLLGGAALFGAVCYLKSSSRK